MRQVHCSISLKKRRFEKELYALSNSAIPIVFGINLMRKFNRKTSSSVPTNARRIGTINCKLNTWLRLHFDSFEFILIYWVMWFKCWIEIKISSFFTNWSLLFYSLEYELYTLTVWFTLTNYLSLLKCNSKLFVDLMQFMAVTLLLPFIQNIRYKINISSLLHEIWNYGLHANIYRYVVEWPVWINVVEMLVCESIINGVPMMNQKIKRENNKFVFEEVKIFEHCIDSNLMALHIMKGMKLLIKSRVATMSAKEIRTRTYWVKRTNISIQIDRYTHIICIYYIVAYQTRFDIVVVIGFTRYKMSHLKCTIRTNELHCYSEFNFLLQNASKIYMQ